MDQDARLTALLTHPDLAVVRQGVELHRALRGALSVTRWRRWQALELHAWLAHHSRAPGSDQPLRLEVRSPRELHRVALLLSRHTALRRDCCVLRIEDTPPSASVVFGFSAHYGAQHRRTVEIRVDGGGLSWVFGERPLR